jgi:UDP-N-acetyl-D-galactosamine dehydrogenase
MVRAERCDRRLNRGNFLLFRPDLMGGPCIGVDAYCLAHKAQEIGYYPEVILVGRRSNDGTGA